MAILLNLVKHRSIMRETITMQSAFNDHVSSREDFYTKPFSISASANKVGDV